MCPLLFFDISSPKHLFLLRTVIYVHLLLCKVYGHTAERQTRGPNECSSDVENPCCPGWEVAPISRLCLLAVCDGGCGSLGFCIGPNLCRCSDGTVARSCEVDPQASSVDAASSGNERTKSSDRTDSKQTRGHAGFSKYDRKYRRRRPDAKRGVASRGYPDVGDITKCENVMCQQRCDVKNGFPQCNCAAGYILDPNGIICNDVDECERYAHICVQGCRNTIGSFMCTCQPGYTLHSDGRWCIRHRQPSNSSERRQSKSSSADGDPIPPLPPLPHQRTRYADPEWRSYFGDMLDPAVEGLPEEAAQHAQNPQTDSELTGHAGARLGVRTKVKTVPQNRPRSRENDGIQYTESPISYNSKRVAGQDSEYSVQDIPQFEEREPHFDRNVGHYPQFSKGPSLPPYSWYPNREELPTEIPPYSQYFTENPQNGVDGQSRSSYGRVNPGGNSDVHATYNPGSVSVDHRYGFNPYYLPDEYNPGSKYEELPPEVVRKVFSKYDRKKLMPFHFDDRDKEEEEMAIYNPGPSKSGPRAISWEINGMPPEGFEEKFITQLPVSTLPCGIDGYECPEGTYYPPGIPDDVDQIPGEIHPPVLPLSSAPYPGLVQQPDSEESDLQYQRSPQAAAKLSQKPHIGSFKIRTRRVKNKRPHPTERNRPRGRTIPKETSQPLHRNPLLPSGVGTLRQAADGAMLQRDARRCRGDLCLSDDELDTEETTVPALGSENKIDIFGKCPKGSEMVIINGYRVCKPLTRTEVHRGTNVVEVDDNIGNEKGLDNDYDIDDDKVAAEDKITEEDSDDKNDNDRNNKKPPPFINFCTDEGKVMVITAKGIHCKVKSDENLFVICSKDEVYVETVAGYICRNPFMDDILSTPIQCPKGHTLIKMNTGYECRGTVTLESSCPDSYQTIQTASGTICSPSAPLEDPCSKGENLIQTVDGEILTRGGIKCPRRTSNNNIGQAVICPSGEILVETDTGPKCQKSTIELAAASTATTDPPVLTTVERSSLEDPVALPPRPELLYTSTESHTVSTEMSTPLSTSVPVDTVVCPKGQVAIETVGGFQCKYYTDVPPRRGDLAPSCPDGQVPIITEQGPICLGASVRIESEETVVNVPKASTTIIHQVLETLPSTSEATPESSSRPLDTQCPSGLTLVNTSFGPQCRLVAESTLRPSCPEGQVKVRGIKGEECIDMISTSQTTPKNVCPEGQLLVGTPRGYECRYVLDSENEIDGTNRHCQAGQTVEQTEDGPICLDTYSRRPIMAKGNACPPNQVAVLTPAGGLCRLKSAIISRISEATDDLQGVCGMGQTVRLTPVGPICINEQTLKPVVDKRKLCAGKKIGIVTPSGTLCKLRSAILGRISKSRKGKKKARCRKGQSVIQTQVGPVCFSKKTLQPIFDEAKSCPTGESGVMTPSGIVCKLRSAVFSRASKKPGKKRGDQTVSDECKTGKTVHLAHAGAICVDETLQAFIDDSMPCPKTQIGVLTPTGISCKLRSVILISSSEDSVQEGCNPGQTVLRGDIGPICFYDDTLEPVFDETESCPDGESAVITPTGTFCKLRSAIFGTISRSTDITPAVADCGIGQKSQNTDAGVICYSVESLQPVINQNMNCPEGQIAVETPSGPLCKLRSAILISTSEGSLHEGCNPGQTVLRGDIGPICFYDDTLEPVFDETESCPDGESAVITPTGTFCKLRSAIFGRISRLTDITPAVADCGIGQKSQNTDAGVICYSVESLQPVINQNMNCPEGQIAVVTPSGPLCKLRSAILISTSEGSLQEGCDPGQTVLRGDIGPICFYDDTLEPVFDETESCPDGESAVITPTGTFCKLRSAIFGTISRSTDITPAVADCGIGQKSQNTDAGVICYSVESLQPVINQNMNCPEGQIAVVTPSGPLCKLRSAILISTSEDSLQEGCNPGQTVLRGDIGPICFYDDTLEPVFDETESCPDGESAVITPTGTFCKLRSAIFGTISRSTDITPAVADCGIGQKSQNTDAGVICYSVESLQPVINQNMNCPEGQIAVVTPSGPLCKLRSAILISTSEDSLQEGCNPGQTVLRGDIGPICFYDDTLEPVFDETESCPEGELAVITPTGTFCKLRTAIFATISSRVDITSTVLGCESGQIVQYVDAGPMCYNTETMLPVTDKNKSCPEGQIAVVTPSGSLCKLRSVLVINNSEKPLQERCNPGQTVLRGDIGPICFYDDTLEPVFDDTESCPDGESAVITPTGTFCKLRTAIFGTISQSTENKPGIPDCGIGQKVLFTSSGAICINEETMQLVIDDGKLCPDGQIGVVTPSGLSCKLRSVLDISTSGKPIQEECGLGQTALRGEVGAICFYDDSLEPVFNETESCSAGKSAVVTPTGTSCKSQTGIFITLLGLIDKPPGVPGCGLGQKDHITGDGAVCLNVETRKPVLVEEKSCPEAEIGVLTPVGISCKLRSAILVSSSEDSVQESCNPGQTVLRGDVGPICFYDDTMKPVFDETESCPEGEAAVITPTGTFCKLRSAIFGTISQSTDAKSPTQGCDIGQRVQITDAGEICYDAETMQPVIDKTKSCPDGQIAVVTPSGVLCELRSVILISSSKESIQEGCNPGQTVLSGDIGPICFYEDTLEPVFDEAEFCPVGELAVITPTGTFCKPSSAIYGTIARMTDSMPVLAGCDSGENIQITEAGAICYNVETMQPVVNKTMNCPEGQVAVVTPSGSLCKIRSAILISTSEDSLQEGCNSGQTVLRGDIGPICFYDDTMEPVFDETESCPEGESAVMTPTGTFCKLRSAIFGTITRLTEETPDEGKKRTAPGCSIRQLVYQTDSGPICVHEERLRPVINDSVSCQDGKVAVVTPTGTFCKLQSNILIRTSKKHSGVLTDGQTKPIEQGCRDDYIVQQTDIGPICVHEDTLQPVLDESESCPDDESAVITPTGTFCKLQSAIFSRTSKKPSEKRGDQTRKYCITGQAALLTEVGFICVNEFTLEPVINETESCPVGESAVITPMGTFCKLRSAIFGNMTEDDKMETVDEVCDIGQSVRSTDNGPICIDEETLKPVVNDTVSCQDGNVAVVTPTGAVCRLRATIFGTILRSPDKTPHGEKEGTMPGCSIGQATHETVVGLVCVDEQTLQPILDETESCPGGESAVLTPTGTSCKLHSVIFGTIFLSTSTVPGCDIGQKVRSTDAGAICYNTETMLPITDESKFCPESQIAVLTPSGVSCKLRSAILISTSEDSIKEGCNPGQTVLRGDIGPICFYHDTLEPVFDETDSCPDDESAVITPMGTFCKLTSAIYMYGTIFRSTDITPIVPDCDIGQKVQITDAGPICYNTETMQPVTDKNKSCPEAQIAVVTPTGKFCKLRSAIVISISEDSIQEGCSAGQTVHRSILGPICFYDDTLEPVFDETETCPDGELAVITPTGTVCKHISAIVRSRDKPPRIPGCGKGQNVQMTDAGPICINEETLKPVIEERKPCPDGQIAVVTPSEVLCKLRSVILSTSEESVQEGCSAGQTVLRGDIGPICLFEDTMEPVFDGTESCPAGELAVITPTGTVCKLRTAIYGTIHRLTDKPPACDNGQKVQITAFGALCVHEKTMQPVIVESKSCPEGQIAVVTPTEVLCKLTSLIIAIFSHISGNNSRLMEECRMGEMILQTKVGAICVNEQTMQPVTDNSKTCPDGEIAVHTPSGTLCKLRTVIVGKLNVVDPPEGRETKSGRQGCEVGQIEGQTEAGLICVYVETMEPVTDESETCPRGEVTVLTPSGPYCKPRSVFFGGTSKSLHEKSGTEDNEASQKECIAGQIVYETELGSICVNEETMQPVVNESMSCQDGNEAVVTPTGSMCGLRTAMLGRVSKKPAGNSEEQIEREQEDCTPSQIVQQTNSGPICVYEETLEPVIDDAISCPDGQAAVVTPSGSVCRLRSAIFSRTAKKPKTPDIDQPKFAAETCHTENIQQTEIGPVCVSEETGQPIIDERKSCPDRNVGVRTPSGSVCAIVVGWEREMGRRPNCSADEVSVTQNGRLVCRRFEIKTDFISRTTPSVNRVETRKPEMCLAGQDEIQTDVGPICVHEETKQPIIDNRVSCSEGLVAVVTPTGTICRLRAIVFGRKYKVTTAPTTTRTTETYPDRERGCPPGQLVASQNGRLICRRLRVSKTHLEICPPGYQRIRTAVDAGQECRYVGFSKKRTGSVDTRTETGSVERQEHRCPFGLLLLHTPHGPACRYPFRKYDDNSTSHGNEDRRQRPNPVPSNRNRPTPPCIGGSNCGPVRPKLNGQTPCTTGSSCVYPAPDMNSRSPCVGGNGCGNPVPNFNGQIPPCSGGNNCGTPIVRTPGGCLNGIPGQPCQSRLNFPAPWGRLIPCRTGHRCGGNQISCQNGNCDSRRPGYPTAPKGCVNGFQVTGNPCGGTRVTYPFAVRQSCHKGFQPYRRGKVYMCIPLKSRGICTNSAFLTSLLGQSRCNGLHQAVPPRHSITQQSSQNGCAPGADGRSRGKSSDCSGTSDLRPISDSSGICKDGEQLFQSPKGIVCLPTKSAPSDIQREAIPTCGASERLVKTTRGYVCQRLAPQDCNPPCANGGTCRAGVCHCPPGLIGNACQTDLDECKRLPSRFCHYRCVNSFASYRCVCPASYTLNADRRTCKSIGCTPDCMNGGSCVGGTCRCPAGFIGRYCQTDMDECRQREGLCEYICRNTIGSYACLCPPGSTLNDDNRSCSSRSCMPACKNGGSCEDHRCKCTSGYYGVSCQLDINECFHFRPCSHLCQNVKGSYKCACRRGYRLSSDGHMCLRIPSWERDGQPRGRYRGHGSVQRRDRHSKYR